MFIKRSLETRSCFAPATYVYYPKISRFLVCLRENHKRAVVPFLESQNFLRLERERGKREPVPLPVERMQPPSLRVVWERVRRWPGAERGKIPEKECSCEERSSCSYYTCLYTIMSLYYILLQSDVHLTYAERILLFILFILHIIWPIYYIMPPKERVARAEDRGERGERLLPCLISRFKEAQERKEAVQECVLFHDERALIRCLGIVPRGAQNLCYMML